MTPADAVPVNKPIVWPSGDIAEQQEVGKPIGKQSEDDEYSEPLKKPWLIHLQHP